MSGTSMAAPHVAGAVALLFEAAGRPLRIEETRALLLSTAAPHDAGEPERAGAGRLDIERALAAAALEPAPLAESPDRLFHQALTGTVPGMEIVARPGERLPDRLPAGGRLLLVRVAVGEPGLGRAGTLDATRARRIADLDGLMPPGHLLLRAREPHSSVELAEQAVDVVVTPFPHPYQLPLEMTNERFNKRLEAPSLRPDLTHLCAAVCDLTGDPALPPFFAHNPIDMLYVASIPKVYALYVAFELRKRVEIQARHMIAGGLSTAASGWQQRVFAALKAAWQPILDKEFPALPRDFPRLAEIFELDPKGTVRFREGTPALTDADLDRIGSSGEPEGLYHDWMRLMLRWSSDKAASRCILPLSYPYINGVLRHAGFFDKASNTGLWLSGDYRDHDWLPLDQAGRPLSPRWAKLQDKKVTNFGGTAFQVGRFMTLLAQGRLVDSPSSTHMARIMTGADGIGSYIQFGLERADPARAFTRVTSKIGYGDGAGNDHFSHDCAVVTLDRGGNPARRIKHVIVVLGSPPARRREDLRALAVAYHDCIVARQR
jgi:hypothetical protein